MDRAQFDLVARAFADSASRRSILGALTGVGLAAFATSDEVTAKKKKKHFCLNGTDVSASSKRKKRKLRKQGAVKGKCTGCTPNCPASSCGGNDGCGGICACASGSMCLNGTCQACTVTCDSDPASCGAALQARLDGGGNIVVCPGRYKPPTANGFTINHTTTTTIAGAGSGADPTSNTVLDQQSAADSLVFFAGNFAVRLSLSGLRMTGGTGNALGGGGFVSFSRVLLDVDDCAFVDNMASNGGGGFHHEGPLNMSNSLVSGNEATSGAGGIDLAPQSSGDSMVITSSVISGNSADAFGGILFHSRFTDQSLTVASSTAVTGNTFTAVEDDRAGGIAMITSEDFGSAVATGATISGNTEPQCLKITGC